MNPDPVALANLRDLALPPPVSWWPPQPGWWVLTAGLLVLALLAVAGLVRHFRTNAYRRAALRALADTPPDGLAVLLKRTALAAYPRASIAGLTGPAWAAFLDRTSGRTGGFPPAAEAVLARAALDPFHPPDAAELQAARASIRRWIRRHRVDQRRVCQ